MEKKKKQDTNKASFSEARAHYQYFIYHDLVTQGYWFPLILIHSTNTKFSSQFRTNLAL